MGSFLMGATGTGNSFAAQAAPIQGQDFATNLAQSRDQANAVNANQNTLGNILMNQVQGGGPAPEQLEAQQMNENAIKSNTGMIASQKGISPALAARMAAQNAAGMQQQAAGQGAMQGMNKQLAVQGALQNLYGQQGQQAGNMYSTDQNAIGSFNNAQVGNTSNMNNTNQATQAQNAKTSGGLVGGLLGGLTGGLFAHGGVVPGQPAPQMFAKGGFSFPALGEPVPAQAQDPMMASGNGLGGMLAKGIMSLFGPKKVDPAGNGGYNQYAESGLDPAEMNQESSRMDMQTMGGLPMPEPAAVAAPAPVQAAAAIAPQAGGPGVYAPVEGDPFAGVGPTYQVGQQNPDFMADGGPVEDHFHHMAKIYHPDFSTARSMKEGGSVPGKPVVGGQKDTTKNDTVPAMLSPGEIVLPRSVTQSKDPVKAAADFVAEKLRSKKGSGNHSADFHDALSKAIQTRRSK